VSTQRYFTDIDMRLRNSFFLSLVAGCVASVPSLASPVTFGQGLEQTAGQNFSLVDTGSGVTLTGTSQIYFVFSNINGTLPAALSGPLSATLTLNLSSNSTDVLNASAGTISEGGFTGTFSITLNTPVGGQTNLLSGTITSAANATLTGKDGGTGASLSASTPPSGSVTYSSAFVQFTGSQTEAFSLALSSVVPSFVDNGSGFLAGFAAAGSLTFSSDPGPSVGPVATPEPISMLLLVFGLTLVGAFGYRLRRVY
jgi:hypothetical protein